MRSVVLTQGSLVVQCAPIVALELDGSEPWLPKHADGHTIDSWPGIPWSAIVDGVGAPFDQSRAVAIIVLRLVSYADYRRTEHWQAVRRRALARYRGQCLCGKNAVDAHHVHYARRGFERPEDVVALCGGCHDAWHDTWRLQAGESVRNSPDPAL